MKEVLDKALIDSGYNVSETSLEIWEETRDGFNHIYKIKIKKNESTKSKQN